MLQWVLFKFSLQLIQGQLILGKKCCSHITTCMHEFVQTISTDNCVYPSKSSSYSDSHKMCTLDDFHQL